MLQLATVAATTKLPVAGVMVPLVVDDVTMI